MDFSGELYFDPERLPPDERIWRILESELRIARATKTKTPLSFLSAGTEATTKDFTSGEMTITAGVNNAGNPRFFAIHLSERNRTPKSPALNQLETVLVRRTRRGISMRGVPPGRPVSIGFWQTSLLNRYPILTAEQTEEFARLLENI